MQSNSVERRFGDERVQAGGGVAQDKVRRMELALYGCRRAERPVTQSSVGFRAALVMALIRVQNKIKQSSLKAK